MTGAVVEGAPGSTQAVAPWRLLYGFGLPAAENMAVDEALLKSVIAGRRPVMRFYTWKPSALSLGVNQPVRRIDRDSCQRLGFGLVRRITGGRAVLHQHELTYSLIARENDPRVSGGVLESYRKISLAIADGLRMLGAQVVLAPPSRDVVHTLSEARRSAPLDDPQNGSRSAVCFDAASAYELSVGGRKLVGSAQARRGGALLQHGSILLDIDWDSWANVFAYTSEEGKDRARSNLPGSMVSLGEVLGRPVAPEEVAAALCRGFEETLGIGLEPGAPDAPEREEAQRLEREKYATDEWTLRL